MNKTQIRELLERNGISGIVSGNYLAEKLGFNIRTINKEAETGRLRKIDRNAYDLDSVIQWLFTRQRYAVKLNSKELAR